MNNLESVDVKDIGDITGDGTSDLLVLSYLGQASSFVRSIYALDRVTGDEVWRYSVTLSDLATKGARDINIERDFTGDGLVDILSYRQSDVPDDLLEMGNHSFVFVIDSADGSLVWERPITNQLFYNSSLNHSSGLYEDWNVVNRRIASLDTTPDLNSDGISDVVVGGESGTIYLLDGSDGVQVWNMTNDDIGWLPWYPQIFTVEDGSITGLVVTDFTSQIFFSNLTSNDGLSVNYSWRYPENLSSPDNDVILPGSVRLDEDINGDGRSDIVYFNNTRICHVLDGSDGSPMGSGFSVGEGNPPQNNFAHGVDLDSAFFSHDFNGNGFKDAVVFKAFEDKRGTPQIIAVDGKTHNEIWVNDEIFLYVFASGMPLRIIDDYNNDNISDIVVGISQYKTQGAEIQILDGKTGQRLKIIQYEEQLEFSDWNMAQPVFRISTVDDVSGNGNKDMIVQRTTVIDDENVNVLELVDIQTGILLRQIPMDPAVAKDNGDINSDGKADILITQGNSIYCLDGDFDLAILSPKDEETVDDKFLLEWNLKDVECEIFVDGISYGYYTDGEAKLTLTGGEHEIIIETKDEFGGILTDTITVNIPLSNIPWIINITALIALIIFIIVTFIIKRAKLNKREEHWREKRREIETSKNDLKNKSKKVSKKQKINRPSDGKTKKPKKTVAKSKPKEVSK
jgi:hypothetical protein